MDQQSSSPSSFQDLRSPQTQDASELSKLIAEAKALGDEFFEKNMEDKLRPILTEHLSLTQHQLKQYSTTGVFIALAILRTVGDETDEELVIAVKKKCVALVSQQHLTKIGDSACCAIKHIDNALRVEAVISESAS